MILQAANGCYLTEAFEVPISERRFLKSIDVADMQEAALWKEVTEAEKDYMIEQGKLFCPDNLSYDYLENLSSLIGNVSQKINGLSLTNEQALEMKRFYPQWEDVLGIEADAAAGFKFNYNDVLLEVVTPHTLSNDNLPTQRPMILSVPSDTEESGEVVYFRPVITVESVSVEPIYENNEENVND